MASAERQIEDLAALITVVAEDRPGMWTAYIGSGIRRNVFGASAGAAKRNAARALHTLGWRAVSESGR